MELKKLPNATLILVLGIFGYICCCFSGLGVIPSGIAFYLAQKSEKIYSENPDLYDNFSQIKTGKIIALVALILNVLLLIRIFYLLSTVGWSELYNEVLEGYQRGLEAQGN